MGGLHHPGILTGPIECPHAQEMSQDRIVETILEDRPHLFGSPNRVRPERIVVMKLEEGIPSPTNFVEALLPSENPISQRSVQDLLIRLSPNQKGLEMNHT